MVRLRSHDFCDRPRADPRYFTDPEGHDMAVMLHGVRIARRIAEQSLLHEWVASELAPRRRAATDDELAYCIITVYHPACMVRMGPD
jgi:choline dehydrogenase